MPVGAWGVGHSARPSAGRQPVPPPQVRGGRRAPRIRLCRACERGGPRLALTQSRRWEAPTCHVLSPNQEWGRAPFAHHLSSRRAGRVQLPRRLHPSRCAYSSLAVGRAHLPMLHTRSVRLSGVQRSSVAGVSPCCLAVELAVLSLLSCAWCKSAFLLVRLHSRVENG